MEQVQCEHNKVFANYVLNSNPPQIPWICSNCLEKGTDRLMSIGLCISYDDLLQNKELKN